MWIGITIGDTCYFSALRRLGAGHTILLEYLAPPFAAVIAWLFLSETLSGGQIVAALVVITGVLLVLTERQPIAGVPLSRSGVLFGVAAAICQAVGLVMAFYAFQHFSINALQAAMFASCRRHDHVNGCTTGVKATDVKADRYCSSSHAFTNTLQCDCFRDLLGNLVTTNGNRLCHARHRANTSINCATVYAWPQRYPGPAGKLSRCRRNLSGDDRY